MATTTEPVSSTRSPSLSFPRATFAKLSPRPFLLAHLQPSSPQSPILRANGRAPGEARQPVIHTGSLTHADGSAVVRTGDTAVVCGVRGEILLASDVPSCNITPEPRPTEVQDLGLLVPNLELSTGCSPAHLPGQPPSPLAQSLTARLLALLHASRLVHADDLRIWHRPQVPTAGEGGDDDETAVPAVKAFWTLYIDVLFISLDGNPFDAAWAAILAALGHTRLPRAYWDLDRAMILCDDAPAETRPLRLAHQAFPATFSVFTASSSEIRMEGRRSETTWVLADPDAFEEALCEESITVVLNAGAEKSDKKHVRILRLEKTGGGAVGNDGMAEVVAVAARRCLEWQDAFRAKTSNAS